MIMLYMDKVKSISSDNESAVSRISCYYQNKVRLIYPYYTPLLF